MNFIDEALQTITDGEAFVNAMADIYKYSEVREQLTDYPAWIGNIITIIDYDSELVMEGLDFRVYTKEIAALKDMGLTEEAQLLSSINEQSSDEELESCYSALAFNNDYDSFWAAVYDYARSNLQSR